MWRTPEGADRMRYRNRKTDEIIEKIIDEGKISCFEDVLHGSEYLEAHCSDKIGPDDILVMFAIDGAQLYRDKESDCWFAIWVILNISPDQRYKKKYVLPAFFVPGVEIILLRVKRRQAYVTKCNLDACLIVIGHRLDTDKLYNICHPNMS